MTLEKMILGLLAMHNNRTKDYPVVITLKEPHVGPSPHTEVTGVLLGFDWDKGKVVLFLKDDVRKV